MATPKSRAWKPPQPLQPAERTALPAIDLTSFATVVPLDATVLDLSEYDEGESIRNSAASAQELPPGPRTKKQKCTHEATTATRKPTKTGKSSSQKGSRERVAYTEAQDLMIMKEVMGNDGMFDRCGESKVDRWVAMTQRLSEIFEKELTAGGLRKHVEKLAKDYRTLRAKEKTLSGKEPHKTPTKIALHAELERFVQATDEESAKKNERTAERNKKLADDRAKGTAIRQAALTTEKPRTKAAAAATKRTSPTEFLQRLEAEAAARREQERSERSASERRFELLLEQGARAQRDAASLMLAAIRTIGAAITGHQRQEELDEELEGKERRP